MLSYGAPSPVPSDDEPSSFAVYLALIAEPSVRVPLLVTLTPPGAASRVTVRFFTGHGAGVYLHFATLAFQVPRELSAPLADTVVVIAKANNARLNIFRIS